MDFFFSVQELLDVECVLGIVVGRELIVGMLGQIVLVREERPHSSKLQDAFAAVQHRQLVPAHKLFATMSSDELKKAIKEILLR